MKILWLEKKNFSPIVEVKAKAIFNACAIAKDQNYIKILIESDCEVIIDAILRYSNYPWSMFTLVEDIKLLLGDFPHVSILWINCLGNIIAYESAQCVYNVIKSG